MLKKNSREIKLQGSSSTSYTYLEDVTGGTVIHTVIEIENFLETGFRGLVFTLHPVTNEIIKSIIFRGEYYLSLHSSSLAL